MNKVALSFHEEVGSSLSIFNDSNLILTYNYHRDLSKPYFHPVNAPNTQSVTSNTPEDNTNHHGLWFGWSNVNGINFWAGEEGKIEHNKFQTQEISDHSAKIISTSNWSVADKKTLIEQTSEIIVYEPRHPTKFTAIDEDFGFISPTLTMAEPYTIKADESLHLRYRVLIHLEDLFTFDLWKCYKEYIK